MFVIVRNTDGKFVTRRGTEQSYSNRLQDAQVCKTREEAEKELCYENEHIEDIRHILGINS